jgi:hypothetical protein
VLRKKEWKMALEEGSKTVSLVEFGNRILSMHGVIREQLYVVKAPKELTQHTSLTPLW